MRVSNSLYPSEEQMKGFLESGPEGPICMVNLLKFRPRAEYEDGRESQLSGREAYGLYARGVSRLIQQVGGYLGVSGEVQRLMLGEVEELWDTVALAVYPSRRAMLEMMQLPEYREISVHRSAGLVGQLNIETAALSGRWPEGAQQT
jgi:uncharacterized protein (DUF1330 family)